MPFFFIMKFPVRATIYSKRANRIQVIHDKARRIEDAATGDIYYRLKGQKKNTLPVPYSDIYSVLTNSGKASNQIFFYSPAPGLYFQIQLSADLEAALNSGNVIDVERALPAYIQEMMPKIENKDKIKIPINEKIETQLDWFGMRMYKNRAMTDVRGMLEKNLPIILVLMTVIMVGIAMFIMFRGMEGMIDRAASSEQMWREMVANAIKDGTINPDVSGGINNLIPKV